MASVRNALLSKRGKTSGPPSIRDSHHDSYKKKSHRELRAIRALGLTAIFLGIVALVLLGVKMLDGQAASQNANALLDAYKTRATAALPPATESATDEPTETPDGHDDDYERTDLDADASAASNVDQHLADDGSVTSGAEAGEYVQPDAPEISDVDKIINRIIKSTGEDGLIGILEIPRFDQELPIIGKWSYDLLKISICRYQGPGPNEKGNLVLIGHNYKSGAHFGNLKHISVGDELFLTNAKTGERVRYEVYEIKHIAPDAFSALKSYRGTAGLTLMTCRSNGTNRLLIRCEQKAATPTLTATPLKTPITTPS